MSEGPPPDPFPLPLLGVFGMLVSSDKICSQSKRRKLKLY